MKIKVESEKIIKAVKKLDEIEVVLENPDDAKEAINLILRKTDLFNRDEYGEVKDVKVTSLQKYETSAVNYKMIFLLEFIFNEEVPLDTKVSFIKELQDFFNKI
jgi:chemotaxis protein CheY-P-specific phosphatase CheC